MSDTERARRVLVAGITNRYDEAAILSELIQAEADEGDRVALTSYIIQNYGILEPTGEAVPLTPRKMSRERWEELRELEGEVMDAQIKRAFKELPTPDEAAATLLRHFEAQPTPELKDFFIANILADSRIPYLEIPRPADDASMSDERYNTLRRKLLKYRRQLDFIVESAGFPARTVRAAHVLAVLNTVDDPAEKAVLMAHALEISERTAKAILLEQALRRR